MGKQRKKDKSPDTRIPSTNLTDWEEHARDLVRLGILPPTVLSNGNYDPNLNRTRTSNPRSIT
jgi:hypothetical protein